MPAWSPEIANGLIRMASSDGKVFDQMQLQELVYIAHGWCLAMTGEPLTGDRPEAMDYGPEYRRLAEALASWGNAPVTSEIDLGRYRAERTEMDATNPDGSELVSTERNILAKIYSEYGGLQTSQLATLTRATGTPWDHVFAGGAGRRRDIPHLLIRAQFEKIADTIDR